MNKYNYLIFCLLFLSNCTTYSSSNTDTVKELQSYFSQIKENPKDASLYFARGQYYQKNKKDSLAIVDFEKAVQLDSTKAKYFSAAANLLFDLKDKRSIPYLQKALTINPNDIVAQLKVARIQCYTQNYTEAFKSINTVLRTDVYNYEAYFLKGLCYKDLEDTTNAISSFQTASRINPENADPYLQLGLLLSNKDIKQAILYFENSYKADTNNVEPLNGIGMLYQTRNQNALAKKAFIRCIEANPGFAKAYYNIGCVLMDEDSLPKAMRQFDIATKHDPQYKEAFYNRGLCKELQKDMAGALQDYELAVQINPDFSLAIDGKKRLEKK
jgi:tetratricopeptide (TPR) repeat protein